MSSPARPLQEWSHYVEQSSCFREGKHFLVPNDEQKEKFRGNDKILPSANTRITGYHIFPTSDCMDMQASMVIWNLSDMCLDSTGNF